MLFRSKDSAQKRRQTRLLFGLALEQFRDEIKGGDSRRTARRLERTLDALEHIDRNVNVPLVIETWAMDLR